MKNIKNLALGLVLLSSVATNHALAVATDIENHWAMNDIIYLECEGILPSYSDNKFRPDYEISLGEYLYSINSLLGYSGIKQNDPNNTVTREDAVRILGLALGLDRELPKSLYNFKDYSEICNSSIVYANILYEKGHILGDERGYFKPKKNMTRGEVAGLLSNIKREIDGSNSFINYGDYHLKIGTYLSIDGAKMERKVLMDLGYTNTIIVRINGQKNYIVLAENSLSEYDAKNFQIRLNNESIKTEVIKMSFNNMEIIEGKRENLNLKGSNIKENKKIYTEGYSVQNGVFTTYKLAEEQRKKLYNKGFKNSFIAKGKDENKYYLLVDSGLTRQAADELRVRLISNGFDSFMTNKVFRLEKKEDLNTLNNNNNKLEKINLGYYIQTGVYSSYDGAKKDHTDLVGKGFNNSFVYKDGNKYYVVAKAYLNDSTVGNYLNRLKLLSINSIIKSNKIINKNQIIIR